MNRSGLRAGRGLALAVLILAGACSPAPQPTATPPSLPRSHPAAGTTQGATASVAATLPASTSTPQPVPTLDLPVAAGTAYPTPGSAIGAQNASSLRLLSEIGFGGSYFHGNFGLQLSADEKRLIVTSTAGIGVFSAADLSLQHFIATGELKPDLSALQDKPTPTNLSRDGSLAATATPDGNIQIWDLLSGQLRAEYPSTLPEDAGKLELMAFSPDDNQLAGVTEQGMIVVLNTADGKIVKVSKQHFNSGGPAFLRYSLTGKYLYYIFFDVDGGVQFHGMNPISLAETAYSADEFNRFAFTYGVFSPVLSDTGYEYGYFANSGWEVDVTDFRNFGPRYTMKLASSPSAIGVSANGKWIVTADSYSNQIEVREAEKNKAPVLTFPGHADLPWGVAITSDGQTVYSVGMDGRLLMWQAGQQNPLHEFTGFYPDIDSVQFSRDGTKLLLSTLTSAVFELSAQNGNLQDTLANPREPLHTDWFTQYTGSVTRYFDTDIQSTYGQDHGCFGALSGDGAWLAQMCNQGRLPVRLWDMSKGVIDRTFSDPAYTLSQKWGKSLEDAVENRKMAFSPDGHWLAVTYDTLLENTAIRIFDVPAGRLARTVKSATVVAMAFSPDGKSLVTSSESNNKLGLQVIDPASGKTVQTLALPKGETSIDHFMFSPDGSTLLTVNTGVPEDLDTYDTRTWAHLQNLVLPYSSNDFTSMAVSPDGSLAVLGSSQDGQLNFWDIHNNTVLAQPLVLPNVAVVLDIAFSPDGRLLVVAGQDSRIRVLGVVP